MFKLIGVDIDGTLLKGDGTISKRTKEYFNKYINEGGIVVISTGRPIQGVKEYLKELNLLGKKGFVINNNGSTIYSTENLERIYYKGLKKQDGLDIVNLAKEIKVKVHGFQEDRCIAIEKNKYTKLEEEHIKIKVDVIDYNLLNEDEDIIKMMLLEEGEVLEKAVSIIPVGFKEKYNVVRSTPYMLEFMNKEANKGNAMEWVCNKLNIHKDEIATFGDGDNDREMLMFSKVSVAMGNGSEKIKKIASHITLSNEEDGIVEFLESYEN